jgi:hypothetical protein
VVKAREAQQQLVHEVESQYQQRQNGPILEVKIQQHVYDGDKDDGGHRWVLPLEHIVNAGEGRGGGGGRGEEGGGGESLP